MNEQVSQQHSFRVFTSVPASRFLPCLSSHWLVWVTDKKQNKKQKNSFHQELNFFIVNYHSTRNTKTHTQYHHFLAKSLLTDSVTSLTHSEPEFSFLLGSEPLIILFSVGLLSQECLNDKYCVTTSKFVEHHRFWNVTLDVVIMFLNILLALLLCNDILLYHPWNSAALSDCRHLIVH